MSYIGRIGGPRTSDIIERLGPNYFGISDSLLELEVQMELLSERLNAVVPVVQDCQGEFCYIFAYQGEQPLIYHLTGEEVDQLGDNPETISLLQKSKDFPKTGSLKNLEGRIF